MLRGFAKEVSGYLCLLLAALALLSTFYNDQSLKQAETTSFSAPHSVLFFTQQTKFVTVRPLQQVQPDGHPIDVHPAVECASFSPPYAKAAPFSFTGKSNPGPRGVGWRARAPPLPIMPVKS